MFRFTLQSDTSVLCKFLGLVEAKINTAIIPVRDYVRQRFRKIPGPQKQLYQCKQQCIAQKIRSDTEISYMDGATWTSVYLTREFCLALLYSAFNISDG